LRGSAPEWAAHLPAGDNWNEYDPYEGQNVPQVLQERSLAAPDRPVLNIEPTGWITRGELDELVSRLAGGLLGLGVSKRDRVVLSSAASLEYIAMLLATMRTGAIAVPTNPSYQRGELKRVVRLVQPAAVYAAESEVLEWAREETPSTILISSPADLDHADAAGRIAEIDRSDPAMIFMSSGTTGESKGAVLSHGNLLAGARAVIVAWRWSADDRLILPLPLFHVHGLAIGLLGTFLVGGSAVVHSKFEVDRVFESVVEHQPTMLFGVPTTYARLVCADDVGKLRALRLCVSGSAPLPTTLFERFRQSTGHRLLERYGMTESLLTLSNLHDGPRKPGTVGLPLPGVEARIESLERVDDAGELLVRGPSVSSGYWRRSELTQQAFTDDGWLRTGDLASQDEDGYFRIVGRLKELIITGGENVHPGEVEDALRQHKGVRDVAVIGVPSEAWGEEVVAFVVADSNLPEEELVKVSAAELASYKRPKRYLYLKTIPVNAMGKVDRDALNKRFEREASGAGAD